MNTPITKGRRGFLKRAAALGAGIAGAAGFSLLPSNGFAATDPDKDLSIIGPKEGYSPQIGTLVSMMAFMRWQVLASVKGMTTEQLDFLLDDGRLLADAAVEDKYPCKSRQQNHGHDA